MNRCLVCALACVGATAVAEPLAFTNSMITHDGQTDPSSEGWVFRFEVPSSPPIAVGPGEETTATGSHEYWRVEDTSLEYFPHYVGLLGTPLPAEWTLQASVRLVSSPLGSTWAIPGHAVFVIDGRNRWSFCLGEDVVGPVGPFPTLPRSYEIDTVSDYVRLAIQFSSNGPGDADDSADFYVNGRRVFTDVQRTELLPEDSSTYVFFGAVSSSNVGKVHYEYISLAEGIIPIGVRICNKIT